MKSNPCETCSCHGSFSLDCIMACIGCKFNPDYKDIDDDEYEEE